MACNRTREMDDAMIELAKEAGAQIEFISRGGGRSPHRRVVFTFNGRSRFKILSGTPRSGDYRNALTQAKRELRLLGAVI